MLYKALVSKMTDQKKMSCFLTKDNAKGKKASSWVTSAFDGFDDEFKTPNTNNEKWTTNTGSKKRDRSAMQTEDRLVTMKKSRQQKFEVDVWVDKHKPKTKNELAVHKKKILEVEHWLKEHIEKSTPNDAPILLLTGPAGAGKTATVQTLAKEMHLEVQEWTNPVTEVYQNDVNPDFGAFAGQRYQSQTTLFWDFITRANKYQTLQLVREKSFKKKVIVIEDLPHTFLRDPQSLHSILRKYKKSGRSPLVFIISDTARGDNIVRKVLPKDLQIMLDIQDISFNPVAPTSMCKVLTNIATVEAAKGSCQFQVPCKSTIDALSTASAGDIRGAINALQFACFKDTSTLKSRFNGSRKYDSTLAKKSFKSTKRKNTTEGKHTRLCNTQEGSKWRTKQTEDEKEGKDLVAIGGRDTSMFLFRALGKILYCKRVEPKVDANKQHLPPHLQHHDRDHLKFDPEDVICQTQISSDMFNLYLHQNYLEFYTRVDDVVLGSEYLSDADLLSSNWSHRSILSEYSSCLATRGLIHCNSSRSRHNSATGSMGWKQLHKPQWWQVAKQCRENALSAKALFVGHCWTPVALHTQLLPYLSRINSPLNNRGQISLLQELNSFSTSTRARVERLNEKDVETMEGDDTYSQISTVYNDCSDKDSVLKSSLYDNDIHIGDFDDDNNIDDFYEDDNW